MGTAGPTVGAKPGACPAGHTGIQTGRIGGGGGLCGTRRGGCGSGWPLMKGCSTGPTTSLQFLNLLSV